MHSIIDLRSDTVTRPSPEMRRAMVTAEVGDDVFEDDPTVNALQEKAALLTGKEAALLMPSGTMSNAAAICTHTRPGDEILLDAEAHSMLYEVGLPATIAHVMTRQFHSEKGIPDEKEILRSLHTESLHGSGTTLLILENTHNRAGGYPIPLSSHQQLWKVMKERGVPIHIDGARIFNASIARGIEVKQYASYADSITFCLSKGLGCPVGSILCGPEEFISRARRVRKMLGGGMRQAGMLAAAGLYALDNNIARLSEDHQRARMLTEGLSGLRGITVDTFSPPTNMVYCTTWKSAGRMSQYLAEECNVLCHPTADNRIRLVTHLDIDDEDIERAISSISAYCSKFI